MITKVLQNSELYFTYSNFLHVSADYLQCSFEFENMKTRK